MANAMSHSPWLVALSVILAIQGSYVGLNLAVQIAEAGGVRRRLLLAGAAISLALGVWTMHFVGMLAARAPFPVDYLVFPTLLSFLVCVIVVGAAVLAASAGAPTLPRIGAAALFMGLGIVAMHYIGMQTLHACAEMVNSAPLVLASVAVAIAASGLALWLAFGQSSHSLLLSAAALGLAISGMHYTAMTGLSLFPRAGFVAAPALSPDLLAVLVAFVAFVVSGGFLLLLVPEGSGRQLAAAPPAPVASPPEPVSATSEVATSEPGKRTFPGDTEGTGRKTASHIPIERNGVTHYFPVDAIFAIRADAHYTKIFDGETSHFSTLSISEIEHRLDPGEFLRAHRSHIVSISRIADARFNGDGGAIELASKERYTVPVSRSHISQIRARLSGSHQAAE